MRLIIIFAYPAFFASGLCAATEYQSLSMQGESYPNACSAEGKKSVRDVLLKNEVQNSSQALKVVDAMLCLPNDDKNRSYLESVTPQMVRKTVESTGDKPAFTMVPRTDELVSGLVAAGKAWNVTIRLESRKLVIQYFSNEACVKERTLFYVNSKWSVYELSEACD
jgi:hypothetical protein